jgi:ribosomal protein S10
VTPLAKGEDLMPEQNKRNLLYFESSSMRDLYDSMENWQNTNHKRLLSISIQQDAGKFCCIALTNPSEVVIMDMLGRNTAFVSRDGLLSVKVEG